MSNKAFAGPSPDNNLTLAQVEPEMAYPRGKIHSLIISAVVAFAITVLAGFFAIAETFKMFSIAHPLFWAPIAIGGIGVTGSSWLYLKRLIGR